MTYELKYKHKKIYLSKKFNHAEVKKIIYDFINLTDVNFKNLHTKISELEKKLEQCNYITQDTFLSACNNSSVRYNKVMERLDALEKEIICDGCKWEEKYNKPMKSLDINDLPKSHSKKCKLEKEKPFCHKPKVGEIWKTPTGSNFLIKEIKDTYCKYYYGAMVKVKKRFFNNDIIEIDNDFPLPICFSEDNLKEKIC